MTVNTVNPAIVVDPMIKARFDALGSEHALWLSVGRSCYISGQPPNAALYMQVTTELKRISAEMTFLSKIENLRVAAANGSVMASILLPLLAEQFSRTTADPALDQAVSDAWKDFAAEKPALEGAKTAREAAKEAARKRREEVAELKARAETQLAEAQARKIAADIEIAKREQEQTLAERRAAERRKDEMAPFKQKMREALARKANADANRK
jgi:hypothetical protein